MSTTLIDAILRALIRSTEFNQNDQVAPDCILWPDKQKDWQRLMPALQSTRGSVLVLGDYDPQVWSGPAIWLRTVLAHQAEGALLPRGVVPLIYLPGVSRAELRDTEEGQAALQPLAELTFRGALFVDGHDRDWTIVSFLKDRNWGLGVKVASDARTARAAARALEVLAHTPTAQLSTRYWNAQAFDELLINDFSGRVLHWLNSSDAARQAWPASEQAAFRETCKTRLGWDCDLDGPLAGAERLARQQGEWNAIWTRFAEAPLQYPNIPALLDRCAPAAETMASAAVWPAHNRALETQARDTLLGLQGEPPAEARAELLDLASHHRERADNVWARRGQSPLAVALGHLAVVAETTGAVVPLQSAEAIAAHHREIGWRADLFALRALASVRTDRDIAAIHAALRAVYLPWLEDAANKLQRFLNAAPDLAAVRSAQVMPDVGECVLFADGLRFDIGRLLAEALARDGYQVADSWRWAALPTVTATCKPAVSPIAQLLDGGGQDADFLPHVASSGRPLASAEFKLRVEATGVQVLAKGATGDPSGRGWTEHGDLDKHGHDEGWKIALRVDEQVFELTQRVKALVDAGWQQVRVVTDHGWLMCPGGLERKELHSNLARSKWSRCAVLQHDAVTSTPVAGWSWCAGVQIGLAPGASVFWAGNGYAHGGWSPQEAVLPVLHVRSRGPSAKAVFAQVSWVRLRCTVQLASAPVGAKVDLRARVNDPNSSVLSSAKSVDGGKCKLTVDDDTKEGTLAFLVVLDPSGQVIAKQQTTIGGDG